MELATFMRELQRELNPPANAVAWSVDGKTGTQGTGARPRQPETKSPVAHVSSPRRRPTAAT
jgi:hypothetical protein